MSAITPKSQRDFSPRRAARRVGRFAVCAASVLMAGIILAVPHGFSAAAGDKAAAISADAAPIVLAGRWTGPRHGYNLRAPGTQDCGGKRCELTYDIVACPEGWCGIAVTEEMPCGQIGMRIKQDTAHNRRNAFMGKLELAKGSAAYTVEAWYAPPGETAGDGSEQARLHFVGDTGDGGMLMMRRSFPFQAELRRISDAQCTLDKATS